MPLISPLVVLNITGTVDRWYAETNINTTTTTSGFRLIFQRSFQINPVSQDRPTKILRRLLVPVFYRSDALLVTPTVSKD